MNKRELRKATLEMMTALDAAAVSSERIADELVLMAAELVEDLSLASVRNLARWHRVRALELRAQLAALSEHYAVRFDGEL